jgi:hypothetical protein
VNQWILLSAIAASALAYFLLATRLGVYQRFPVLHYGVMLAASVWLFRLLLENLVVVRILTTGAGVGILGGFAWYTLFYSSYPRRDLAIAAGDGLANRLAGIEIETSAGEPFRPLDELGRSRATLLVFYRGWW